MKGKSIIMHEFLLLFLNLSQMKKKVRIIKVFQEAWNSRDLGIKLEYSDEEREGKTYESVATRDNVFGYFVLSGDLDKVDHDVSALARNLVKTLAVILENLQREELLEGDKEELGKIVDERVAEIRESELRNRTLLENLPQKIFYKDKDLVYVACNENYAKDLKIDAGEIRGKTDFDFYPKELAEKYRADDSEVINTGIRKQVEERYVLDGKESYVNTIKTPVKNDKGENVGVVGIFWDITERKKAEERDRFLSSAVEQSSEGIAIVDMDGNLQFCNEAFAAMHGYSPGDVLGKDLSIFHTPEQMPAVNKANRHLKKTGRFKGEIWHARRDGTVFPTVMHNTLLKDAKGDPVGMIGTLRDITDQREREKELEIFKDFSESARQAFGFADLEGRIFYGNKTLRKILGHKKMEDMIGTSVFSYYPDGLKKRLEEEALPQVLEKGNWVGESALKSVDGKVTPTIENIFLIKGEKGEPLYYANVITDITDRKNAETVLRESEEKYKSLFEFAGDAIFIMDVSKEHGTRFIDCNDRTLGLFGCTSRDQIIGKTPVDFSPSVQPDGQPSQEKAMKLAAAVIKGQPQVFEWAHLRLDGTSFWVEVTLTPLELGGKFFMQAVVRDITDRKKLDQMKDNLIRDVSHSLKTPIATAKMAQGICAEGLKAHDAEKMSEFHKMATDNINAAHKDITNILELFSITAKEPLTMKQKVSLNTVVTEIARDMKSLIETKKLDLKIDIPEEANKILGNRREITTLLSNIIDNAVKFTEKGGIKLSAKLSGEMVEIKIKDSGTGVAKKDRGKLFERFQKGHTAFTGVGLGLAISKEIVERHNGNIKVESDKGKGKGTTVVVRLPRG